LKVRRIKWVTVVVVQINDEVETLIGFGKRYYPIGDLLIEDETGTLMRVIYVLPIKVIE